MTWRRLVPLEVFPLGVFSVAVIGFAGYRCWKLSNHSEVMLTKKSGEKFAWKDEDESDKALVITENPNNNGNK